MAVSLSQKVTHNPTVPSVWSHWLSCVAVANVCLIRIWTEMLAYPVWLTHRDYDPPQLTQYAAAVLLTLLLGTLFWFALNRINAVRLQTVIGAGILLLIGKESFLAISSLGTVQRASILAPIPLAITILGLGLTGWQLLQYPGRMRKIAVKLAAAMIPLLLLTFGQCAWRSTQVPPRSVRSTEAPRTDAKPRRRVVWLILDELDERVAFTQRRAGTQLPELDRFRREATLVALHARSPDNSTMVSLPQLLNYSQAPGSAENSVVARVRRAGLRSAIVGWALPYCEVFRNLADSCAWWPLPQQQNSYGSGLTGVLQGMSISLFESNQLSLFGQSLSVRHFARTVEEMTIAAGRVAARHDLDFVFLHLPPPHSPYAFNPKTGKIDQAILRFPNAAGYFDNLLLADQVFGRIRRTMEQAGVWENSLVLVTADHGLRSASRLGYGPDDRHVPFMVKSPSPLPVAAHVPLATERTGDLLLNWLLDGK